MAKKVFLLLLVQLFLLGCITSITQTLGNLSVKNISSATLPIQRQANLSLQACAFGESTLLQEDFSTRMRYVDKNVSLGLIQANASSLSDCSVIILYSNELSIEERKRIRERVNGGAGIIFVKEAGTRVAGDPAFLGYGELQDIAPIEFLDIAHEKAIENKVFSGVFVSRVDFLSLLSFAFEDWNVTIASPKRGARVVASLFEGDFSLTAPSRAGIVLLQLGLFKGYAAFFAYDPVNSRDALRLVAEFLARDYLDRNLAFIR